MSHLEGAYEQAGQRLNSIDARLDRMEVRLDGFESRVHQDFVTIDRKIDQRFMWTIGIVLCTWVTSNVTMLSLFFHR